MLPLFFLIRTKIMNISTDDYQIKQGKPLIISRPSPTPLSPVTQGNTRRSSGCCRGLGDCIVMTTLSQGHHLSTSNHRQQVGRTLHITGSAVAAVIQDPLHEFMIKVANTRGNPMAERFLDLLRSKATEISPVSQISRRIPAVVPRNRDLETIINQAKMNRWFIEPHEIELQEQVGEGSSAAIYRGLWRGQVVAVKCIFPSFFQSSENSISFFAQEIELLAHQRHPFVLRLRGACLEPPENGWVVTEFLSTTLMEWLYGHKERRRVRSVPFPPLQQRVAKALEIAQAMQYLHGQKPKVIHRDLKPSNIFLDAAMHVRVADFGHARFLQDGEQAFSGETGTYVYMAPEVIRNEPHDEKCDVYSFAIMLNELMTGQHPYIETDYGPKKIAFNVGEGKLRPMLPDDDGKLEDIINLIRSSWDEDPSIRPSFVMITCALRKIQEKLTQEV